jgi:hypothetical protein
MSGPDGGWFIFAVEHGPGGLAGAIIGAVLAFPGQSVFSPQNPLVISSYKNILGMRVSAADYLTQRWTYAFFGGFVGAVIGAAVWEWGRNWYKARGTASA